MRDDCLTPRFAPNIVNYFRVTLHKYIDDNKAFITTMDDRDKKMKPWLDEKASKDFALIAEASSAGVMQRISTAVEAEDCLDDVNKIANTKGDMDDLQEKVKELRDTAHRMAVLHYQLTADFFTNEAGRKTMENAFPSYFTDCQNVIVSCKQQAATWRDYITKLQQMLSLVKSSLMGISHYREKYSLLCTLSREDKAYHQLERYHEYAEKCDQSIEAFNASINIMQKYSKCSVCLTQE